MANEQSLILSRCPKCNCKIIVQRPSGETVVLCRVLVVRNGRVMASCPDCKYENEIDGLSYNPTDLIVSDSQEKYPLTSATPAVTISQQSQSHRETMT